MRRNLAREGATASIDLSGGVLTSLSLQTAAGPVELLVPPPAEGARFDGLPMHGSFPMVPFCNRLKPEALNSASGPRAIAANWPAETCAVHGLGWSETWEVEAEGEGFCHLGLTLRDATGTELGRARQEVTLTAADSARLTVSFENTGTEWLETGVGFHPWFWMPGAQKAQVRFQAGGCFVADAALYPQNWQELTGETLLDAAADAGLDRTFADWNGEARLQLPHSAQALVIRSSAPLLHIYIDAERQAFCVEPVTNLTNTTHDRRWPDRFGMTRLQPGQRQELSMELSLAPAPGTQAAADTEIKAELG